MTRRKSTKNGAGARPPPGAAKAANPKSANHFSKFLKDHYDRVLEEKLPLDLQNLVEKLDDKLAGLHKDTDEKD